MVKKILLSVLVVGAFLAYSLHERMQHVSPVVSSPAQPTDTASPNPSQPENRTSQPDPNTGVAGNYKDGTYTGSVESAFYGDVQVQVTVQGGAVTGINFLRYPDDNPTSRAINGQAMPQLQQEAIQAQSAHVDTVTGATDTSMAFIQSLTAALSHAG